MPQRIEETTHDFSMAYRVSGSCSVSNHTCLNVCRLDMPTLEELRKIAVRGSTIDKLLDIADEIKHLVDNLQAWYLDPDGAVHLKTSLEYLREYLKDLEGKK